MSRPPDFVRALAVLASLACPLAAVADEVEHPTYRSWSRNPAGTSITLRSVTRSKLAPIETTTRTTLIELAPGQAMLESRTTTDATGTKEDLRPQRYEQRRMFPLFPAVKKEDVDRPSGAIARGEETVTVAGREYRAQWFDSKGRIEVGETFTQTWMSDEVPGRLLKAVVRVPAVAKTTTDEMIEIRRP